MVHFLSASCPSVCPKNEAAIIHPLIAVYHTDWKELWQHPVFFFPAGNNVQPCTGEAELHCALSYRMNAGLLHLKAKVTVAEVIPKLFQLSMIWQRNNICQYIDLEYWISFREELNIKKWKELVACVNLPRARHPQKLSDGARKKLVWEATKTPMIPLNEVQASATEIGDVCI